MQAVATKPIVISYLRFSTQEQLKGDSTKRQNDSAERWCKENGYILTEANRIKDHGVSAFRGSNRTKGNLATFLELVKTGGVPRGSILLVEDLDRLSRQEPEEALELFLGIIRAGIQIVTLIDGQSYRSGHLDVTRLTMSIMRMCLANEESKKKSYRLGKAWKSKRENMANKPLTSLLPSWLKIENNKIVADEAKAAIIRRIYDLLLEGYGTFHITRKLNAEFKGIGRCKHWNKSYVQKIRHNVAVAGIFQPMKLVYDHAGKKSREPVGEPLRNYYPAIVDEKTFYAVQQKMSKDKGPQNKFVSLFSGMIYDSRDESTMVICQKDKRSYVSSASLDRRPGCAEYISLTVNAVEFAVLANLGQHLEKFDMSESSSQIENELLAVEGKFAEVSSQIDQIAAALANAGNVAAVVTQLKKMETTKNELMKRRHEIEGQLSNSKKENHADSQIEIWRAVTDGVNGVDTDRRIKLRQAVRQFVERIDITPATDGPYRSASISITMKDGKIIKGGLEYHRQTPQQVTWIDARGERNIGVYLSHGKERFDSVKNRGMIIPHNPPTAKKPAIQRFTVERVKALWTAAKRPQEIASECGVSVSQVYRIAKGLKRQGKWKPASRWDIRK